MKIHEYQAKEILKRHGVVVPKGMVAFSAEEAEQIARELATTPVVVKAQIHAGGRGKGGGVKLAKSLEEARQIAGTMLGMTLVTHQTGPEGKEVKKVLVEQGLDIARELYLGIVIDRASEIWLWGSTEPFGTMSACTCRRLRGWGRPSRPFSRRSRPWGWGWWPRSFI